MTGHCRTQHFMDWICLSLGDPGHLLLLLLPFFFLFPLFFLLLPFLFFFFLFVILFFILFFLLLLSFLFFLLFSSSSTTTTYVCLGRVLGFNWQIYLTSLFVWLVGFRGVTTVFTVNFLTHQQYVILCACVDLINKFCTAWRDITFVMWQTMCDLICGEKKNLLDATLRFIELISRSTCFGHYYAHLQELETIHTVTACGTRHFACGWSLVWGGTVRYVFE